MHSTTTIFAIFSILAVTTISAPTPLPSDAGSHMDDIISNSLSPLSDNAAGNANENTGVLNGNTVGRRQGSHLDDIISNSVSPVSNNAAGNSNSNTGVLNGNNLKKKQSDTTSNSLSPLSDNVTGNNNKNTGTLDGNTVNVDPTIDPTINLAKKEVSLDA